MQEPTDGADVGSEGGVEDGDVIKECAEWNKMHVEEHDDAPTMAVKELSLRVAVHPNIGRQADRLTAPVNKGYQQFVISASRHHPL